MTQPAIDLRKLDPSLISQMSDAQFRRLLAQASDVLGKDKKENALLYYEPASEMVERTHLSDAMFVGVFGGNRSSKTTSQMAHAIIHSTGVIPLKLREKYPGHFEKRMRGPVHGRFICQSLINVLEDSILPKLRWNSWTGVGAVGEGKGHWGLIPRMCLIDGEWERSWSARSRTLRLLCRDPENIDRVVGESIIKFFSYDQKPEDFASAHLHWVLFDEPPPLAIWNENKARVMSANGWMRLAMTWPDDPSINVDWLYDEVYQQGIEGPHKHPAYECFELYTTDNVHLDQEAISRMMDTMSERQKQVRIYGRQVRFSNRIHELFTEQERGWCFSCKGDQVISETQCLKCGSGDVVRYTHVEEFDWPRGWPVIWLVDPHPRKPHMSAWIGVDPSDEYSWIAEYEDPGDPVKMRVGVEEIEREMGLHVVRRIMDPRMGGSSSSGSDRERTWLDEFELAGLPCDPASPSDVGRKILNTWLEPDPCTRRPRMRWHKRCRNAIFQFSRFVWDDWKAGSDKSIKQRAKDKNDDYPALGRYFANEEPSFSVLTQGRELIHVPVYGSTGSGPQNHPYLGGRHR